jgi:hypothetical protein
VADAADRRGSAMPCSSPGWATRQPGALSGVHGAGFQKAETTHLFNLISKDPMTQYLLRIEYIEVVL